MQRTHRGIALLSGMKEKCMSTVAHLFLGEMLMEEGKNDEALNHLNAAAVAYRDMGIDSGNFWHSRVRTALERLKVA